MRYSLVFLFLFLFMGINAQNFIDNFKKISETNPNQAIKEWERIYNKADNKNKINVLMYASQAYLLTGDHKQAVAFINRAEDESKSINDTSVASDVLLRKSGTYASLGLFAEAEQYADEGLKTAGKIENIKIKNRITGDLYYQLALYDILQKKNKKPAALLNRAFKFYKNADLSDRERLLRYSTGYYNLGSIYLETHRDSAYYYFDKTVRISGISSNPFILNLSYNNLGVLEYQKNNLESALNYLSKATAYLQKVKDPNLSTNYALLSSIYDKKGQQDKALFYKKKQEEFEKTLNNSQIQAVKYAFTSLEKNRQEAEAKAVHFKTILVGAIITFVVLLITLLYYNHQKNKEQKLLYENIITKLEAKSSADHQSFNISPKQLKEITVPEIKEKDILEKLRKFEETEKFINPKLSLSLLASQFNTNTNYLSEVINSSKGKNYNAYINELRIDFICSKIINDPAYKNYKISYLAEACGFSSHSVFATNFKNIVGISPSDFIKQSKNRSELIS
ncbi:helix-turn-helix domain-containing protein [Chryseobacterium oranimense]|uniref:AraC family transcriptional regulator n=1 Tax=Chryseobacterium oranimense TaxID=421058 RepID=UPI0021B0497B|nr:AraC family transcriptional regulator [Chryseobacterium oranimense]UWX61535.1 helix-turn-helix domain-containing protein [Chryseobacterium oranimense]